VRKPADRCVVDTNVAMTANGANEGAPPSCVAASAKALQTIMRSGHVFIDDGGRIVDEYRRNLRATGQPGPGDQFFKWLLTYEWGGQRVTRVPITQKAHDEEDFVELPKPPEGTTYDRSDRKFLAVAAAHEEHPPILQSFDSKWWGWREALAQGGISVHFLCKHEIAEKHAAKMGA
jgi:hypothetical protein